MPLFTLNRGPCERDGKRRGLIPYLGDFAKMFRMKNHFKILSMAVESGAGAAGRGFHSFSAFKRAMETPQKVINGIISWDNMRIIYVSLVQRVFITRIILSRYRKNCITRLMDIIIQNR